MAFFSFLCGAPTACVWHFRGQGPVWHTSGFVKHFGWEMGTAPVFQPECLTRPENAMQGPGLENAIRPVWDCHTKMKRTPYKRHTVFGPVWHSPGAVWHSPDPCNLFPRFFPKDTCASAPWASLGFSATSLGCSLGVKSQFCLWGLPWASLPKGLPEAPSRPAMKNIVPSLGCVEFWPQNSRVFGRSARGHAQYVVATLGYLIIVTAALQERFTFWVVRCRGGTALAL